MSRSNYSDYLDEWALIRWRGAVKSAIRGKRGQEFLKELLATLDAMPQKELIRGELVTPHGEVCAIGSVLKTRGIDTSEIDIYDSERIADICGIADALVREIEYINDECFPFSEPGLSPEQRRWQIVRGWVAGQIQEAL